MARKTRTPVTLAETVADTPLTPKSLTKQEFGRRLYRLMIKRGWHQSELARQSGVSRDAVSTYIRGRNLPEPQNLQRLASALGVAAEVLLPNMTAEAIADEESPAFEMKTSVGSPGMAWLRVNRLVSTMTAIKVAELLENDVVPDGKRSGGEASVLSK